MRNVLIIAVAGILGLGLAIAVNAQPGPQGGGEGQVYGWQLMTEQERAEHRQRMRDAATAQERERLRREHHERMQQRAAERGVSLPEEPPAVRGGAKRQSSGGNGPGR